MPNPTQSVASVILEHSECAAIFKRHRIDFCCQGDLTIEEACAKKGLDTAAVVAELNQAIADRTGPTGLDPRELSTQELVDHIVVKHHKYLREALPFIQTLSAKVSRVHGGNDPRLVELNDVVLDLVGALIPHLDEEETTLFPVLTADEVDLAAAARELDGMHEEHLEVATMLERLRHTTQDFRLPDWACSSYRTLFAELEQLEADTLMHVHVETHVLKPRFAQA